MKCEKKNTDQPQKTDGKKHPNDKKLATKLKNLKASPYFKQRLTARIIILCIVIAISVIFYPTHGYWALISAIAVLVSEDVADIPKRSLLRIVGAFVGFLIGSCVALIDFGLASTIIFLAVGVILAIKFLPTEKYAIGSAGIGLVAVTIASLFDNATTSELLLYRLLWTSVGAVVVIVVFALTSFINSKASSS